MRWFREYGVLILVCSPMLGYELYALLTGNLPTITFDVRHLLHTLVGAILLGLGWAALTLHFFTGWPS